MQAELRKRSFGELIGLCFQLSIAHFVPLFLIVVLFGLPTLFFQLLTQTGIITLSPGLLTGLSLVAIVISLVTSMVAQGASILIVAGNFSGRKVTVGDAITRALSKFWSLLAVSLAVSLLISVGIMLCIVPGLIFLVWYYVSAPAIMVEDLGYSAAMSRSKTLTQDDRGRALGFILVLALVIGAVGGGGGFVLGMVPLPAFASVTLGYVVNSAVGLLGVVGPVVYYFDTRVKHDGYGLDNLATFVDAIGARGAEGSDG